jgi:replicative DNA helicase
LFIDDTPLYFDLRAKARRLVCSTNPNYYCGLFAINDRWRNGKGGGNREQEISTISRNLKQRN